MSLNKTNIDTTDFSWNPLTGCFKECAYCYARILAYGRLKKKYLANKNIFKIKRQGDPYKNPFWPRFWNERLMDPAHVPKNFRSKNRTLPPGSAMIFTVDMGDLFGPWVPDEWIQKILDICDTYSKHIFQLLTKFPTRLPEFKYTGNTWVGTTVTDVDSLINVNSLVRCDARVKYLSCEPLKEDIFPKDEFLLPTLKFIDWIIVGAQTGKGRKKNFPKKKWVDNIIRAAGAYKIPIFIKENLLSLNDRPTGIERIQEYPTCGFCMHFPRCSRLICTLKEGDICDFIPSRFVPKSEASTSKKGDIYATL